MGGISLTNSFAQWCHSGALIVCRRRTSSCELGAISRPPVALLERHAGSMRVYHFEEEWLEALESFASVKKRAA